MHISLTNLMPYAAMDALADQRQASRASPKDIHISPDRLRPSGQEKPAVLHGHLGLHDHKKNVTCVPFVHQKMIVRKLTDNVMRLKAN